jgi:hypothetical protein
MLIDLFHGCSLVVCSQFVLDLFPVGWGEPRVTKIWMQPSYMLTPIGSRGSLVRVHPTMVLTTNPAQTERLLRTNNSLFSPVRSGLRVLQALEADLHRLELRPLELLLLDVEVLDVVRLVENLCEVNRPVPDLRLELFVFGPFPLRAWRSRLAVL